MAMMRRSWARSSPSCGGCEIRFAIRVKPGAGRSRVGGCYDVDTLVVAVQARAVDGRATAAALAALASAFGVHLRDVALVSGATSRTKIVEISGDHHDRLRELLGI